MLQSDEEVLVHRLRLLVAGRPQASLLEEALSLLLGVVELAEGVGDLAAGQEALEALHQAGVVGFALGQGRYLQRVVQEKGGLDELWLHKS